VVQHDVKLSTPHKSQFSKFFNLPNPPNNQNIVIFQHLALAYPPYHFYMFSSSPINPSMDQWSSKGTSGTTTKEVFKVGSLTHLTTIFNRHNI